MKLIVAIVRTERLSAVLEELFKAHVSGLTISHVQGHGGEREQVETYRGTTVKMELSDKVRLEIGVSNHFVETRPFPAYLDLALRHTRDFQQIVDHPHHLRGLAVEGGEYRVGLGLGIVGWRDCAGRGGVVLPSEIVEDIQHAVLGFGSTLKVAEKGHVADLAGSATSELLE